MAISTIPLDTSLSRRNDGNFPIIDDFDIKGGYRVLATLADRNNMVSVYTNLLKEGMRVAVLEDDTVYKLNSDLTSWTVDSGGGGGGGSDVIKVVRAGSTVNINLAAPGATVDGISFSVGQIFLAKNQTILTENGPYIWNGAAVPATRVTGTLQFGDSFEVIFGLVNVGSIWAITTADPILIGTSLITFEQTGKASTLARAYANAATPTDNTINATATGGGFALIDNVVPIPGILLEVADSTHTLPYLIVDTVNGTVIANDAGIEIGDTSDTALLKIVSSLLPTVTGLEIDTISSRIDVGRVTSGPVRIGSLTAGNVSVTSGGTLGLRSTGNLSAQSDSVIGLTTTAGPAATLTVSTDTTLLSTNSGLTSVGIVGGITNVVTVTATETNLKSNVVLGLTNANGVKFNAYVTSDEFFSSNGGTRTLGVALPLVLTGTGTPTALVIQGVGGQGQQDPGNLPTLASGDITIKTLDGGFDSTFYFGGKASGGINFLTGNGGPGGDGSILYPPNGGGPSGGYAFTTGPGGSAGPTVGDAGASGGFTRTIGPGGAGVTGSAGEPGNASNFTDQGGRGGAGTLTKVSGDGSSFVWTVGDAGATGGFGVGTPGKFTFRGGGLEITDFVTPNKVYLQLGSGTTAPVSAAGTIAIANVGGVLKQSISGAAYTSIGGSTPPGGANTQVQFNDSGAFNGDAKFTFDKTTGATLINGALTVTSIDRAAGLTIGATASTVDFGAVGNAVNWKTDTVNFPAIALGGPYSFTIADAGAGDPGNPMFWTAGKGAAGFQGGGFGLFGGDGFPGGPISLTGGNALAGSGGNGGNLDFTTGLKDGAGAHGEITFAIGGSLKAKFDSIGDFIPTADNTGHLGTDAARWNRVRAVTVVTGASLAFSDDIRPVVDGAVAIKNALGTITTFVADTATGRVGVGTAVPASEFHVAGTTSMGTVTLGVQARFSTSLTGFEGDPSFDILGTNATVAGTNAYGFVVAAGNGFNSDGVSAATFGGYWNAFAGNGGNGSGTFVGQPGNQAAAIAGSGGLGANSNGGAGGDAVLAGGDGGDSTTSGKTGGASGRVFLGGTFGERGGDATVTGAIPGAGRAITITGFGGGNAFSDGATASGIGGNIQITAGAPGNPGSVTAGNGANAGVINLQGAAGKGKIGRGSNININGGGVDGTNATTAVGGIVQITGGNVSLGSGLAGNINLFAGHATGTSTGAGGKLRLIGGNNDTATGGPCGDVEIGAGTVTVGVTGAGGNVIITGGGGGTAALRGNVSIDGRLTNIGNIGDPENVVSIDSGSSTALALWRANGILSVQSATSSATFQGATAVTLAAVSGPAAVNANGAGVIFDGGGTGNMLLKCGSGGLAIDTSSVGGAPGVTMDIGPTNMVHLNVGNATTGDINIGILGSPTVKLGTDTGPILPGGGNGTGDIGLTGTRFRSAFINTVSSDLFLGATDALSGPGAVSITKQSTLVTTTGVADALTLADGSTVGQIKHIVHSVDGGSAILTPTTASGFTTITFTNAGETATLMWTVPGWVIISIFGAVPV